MHLNAFLLGVGHHEAAWRLGGSDPTATASLAHYQRLAAIAERGRFDSLFLADSVAIMQDVRHNPIDALEPTTLLAALAVTTERIGLIATASTTYSEPYELARRFATLDHLSGGRAGWNIVTSGGEREARNFGRSTLPSHAARYARAEEFVAVARALWDSWDADAVVADRATGVYADRARIHEPRHRGEHFGVEGALNVRRSPQGRPLLVQAGSSPAGMAFAARHAEAVFTAQQTLDGARSFYRALKAAVARAARDPDGVAVLPGIVPIIGATEAEAREHERALTEGIVLDYALAQLGFYLDIDASVLDLDAPLPALAGEDAVEAHKSRFTLIVELARRERLTVRELLGRLGGGRGHWTVTGTPEQIADALERWVDEGAADGFNVMAPTLPGGLELFVDHVVPELQRRGRFRREYEPTTLRRRYGLPPVPAGGRPGQINGWRGGRRSLSR